MVLLYKIDLLTYKVLHGAEQWRIQTITLGGALLSPLDPHPQPCRSQPQPNEGTPASSLCLQSALCIAYPSLSSPLPLEVGP